MILILGLLLAGSFFIARIIPVGTDVEAKPELLIYCGITMIKPMIEIAAILEEQEDVKISFIKGGSGNLLRAIRLNQVGDLFLPGSDSYITTAKQESLVSDSVHVGYNKAAMMVSRGNPKDIPGNLDALLSKDYYVVIGDPDSGSIGRETKKILTIAGLFEEVLANARELTTDSKRLVQVLKSGEADVVINWYATATWPENREFISTLPIDGQYAGKKRLELGLLRTSEYPEIARKFMAYAASAEGQSIFQRYGLFAVE